MSIVTLSSDIGVQDYILGAIKGQIITQFAQANIVDINHDLNANNYPHVAYICNHAFKYFPKGTIHLILVDCFEGNNEQFILAEVNGQIIICPDNGLLTMIADKQHIQPFSISVHSAATILEITQILAGIIGRLLQGEPLTRLADAAITFQQKISLQPSMGNDWIEGQVLFIDKFDNVIINISNQQFQEAAVNRPFEISIPNNVSINKISKSYADVPRGEVLAMFNAAGYLELAVNNGKMAALFGLRSFASNKNAPGSLHANALFYQTIRIYFLKIS